LGFLALACCVPTVIVHARVSQPNFFPLARQATTRILTFDNTTLHSHLLRPVHTGRLLHLHHPPPSTIITSRTLQQSFTSLCSMMNGFGSGSSRPRDTALNNHYALPPRNVQVQTDVRNTISSRTRASDMQRSTNTCESATSPNEDLHLLTTHRR